MRLYLFRHGEAGPSAESDAARMLTTGGRQDNQDTARQLAQHDPKISHALCSPYVRAQESALDLATVIPGLQFDTCDLLTPDTDIMRILAMLEHYSEQESASALLLVGHNPLLSRLASYLLEGSSSGSFHLDTSNLVCLNSGLLGPGCAELEFTLRPQS